MRGGANSCGAEASWQTRIYWHRWLLTDLADLTTLPRNAALGARPEQVRSGRGVRGGGWVGGMVWKLLVLLSVCQGASEGWLEGGNGVDGRAGGGCELLKARAIRLAPIKWKKHEQARDSEDELRRKQCELRGTELRRWRRGTAGDPRRLWDPGGKGSGSNRTLKGWDARWDKRRDRETRVIKRTWGKRKSVLGNSIRTRFLEEHVMRVGKSDSDCLSTGCATFAYEVRRKCGLRVRCGGAECREITLRRGCGARVCVTSRMDGEAVEDVAGSTLKRQLSPGRPPSARAKRQDSAQSLEEKMNDMVVMCDDAPSLGPFTKALQQAGGPLAHYTADVSCRRQAQRHMEYALAAVADWQLATGFVQHDVTVTRFAEQLAAEIADWLTAQAMESGVEEAPVDVAAVDVLEQLATQGVPGSWGGLGNPAGGVSPAGDPGAP